MSVMELCVHEETASGGLRGHEKTVCLRCGKVVRQTDPRLWAALGALEAKLGSMLWQVLPQLRDLGTSVMPRSYV